MEFFYLLEENIPVFVFCYNDKFIAAKPAADFFREFVFQNIGKCCNQSVYNKPKIWTKNSKNSEFAVL